MGNKKRKKRSHSPKSPRTADAKLPRVNSANMNSPDSNALSPITLNAIMDTLASLGDKMNSNFKQLREEMESFKHDLKAEIQVLTNTVSELEKNRVLRGEQHVPVACIGLSSERTRYATSAT